MRCRCTTYKYGMMLELESQPDMSLSLLRHKSGPGGYPGDSVAIPLSNEGTSTNLVEVFS